MIADVPTIVTYKPRPNQPLKGDEQQAFYESNHPGVTFLLGGNGAGTTFTTCAKLVKFLMETPPPRKDCPVWLISKSYSMVCKSVWKEKLSPRHGYGLMPDCEIDWERVRWLRSNEGWPLEVPLKPWPGRPGKNYVLSFRSYAQGRGEMQAESIAGFCFFEQFPWGLLEEVLRGCREYAFTGNKLCEFTPVDPSLSVNLQEMEEKNKIPPGWAIYRANTECALEAGHVTQQWFDEFFGMIPDSMQRVRMRGLWGSFEGAVYPEFSRSVHCIQGEWECEPGMWHSRSIDWGFGMDNAFCCLFLARNSIGQVTVYDEYYSTEGVTVIEHLKRIADMYPWPKSAHYGVTWADPSNLNCHRIASRFSDYTNGEYESFSIQAAANSIDEGIEHVKWMLQPDPALDFGNGPEPRLKIVEDKCPNLMREFRTYRYPQRTAEGINVQSVKMTPVKVDDHACFTEDAIVDTPFGQRKLVDLKCGDVVCSHLGLATVDVATRKTGECSTVRLFLSDGKSIECTADHPIGVDDSEWVRADECLGRMVNVRCNQWKSEQRLGSEEVGLKLSSMAASCGEDIPTTNSTAIGNTSRGIQGPETENCVTSCCISKSTRILSDQSPMGWMSTTRTKTPETTILQISNCSQKPTTERSISPTCRKPGRRLRNGTEAPKELSGIGSMALSHGKAELHENYHVSNAAESLKRSMPSRRRDSAQANAGITQGSRLELTTSMSSAASANPSSHQTVTDRRKHARLNVQPACVVRIERLIGKRSVYCCATSDGTMFVNGILVSNCDALRYGLYSEASHKGITPRTIARQHSAGRHGVQISSSKFQGAK